jgi:hypothetical protein
MNNFKFRRIFKNKKYFLYFHKGEQMCTFSFAIDILYHYIS